jgi:GPH family glycoside/pentoside/hexuronide:cation symporter
LQSGHGKAGVRSPDRLKSKDQATEGFSNMSAGTHYKTAPEDRISLKQKSAYAVGMLVNNLQAAALPAMVVILNLGLGMDVLLVGLIGAIPRIFDALSDPMLGYISDNTRTRWGRRRPFIFGGALLAGLIFALMWQLPSGYVDLFSDRTVVEYENPSPNRTDIIFREGRKVVIDEEPVTKGQVVINYNKEQPTESGVILYGPRALMSKSKLVQATDLHEYSSVDIVATMPPGLSMEILFNEAGINPDDGESYSLQCASDDLEDGVLTFDISQLKPCVLSGNQSGRKQIDLQAIKNIVLRFPELEGTGSITVDSFCFHKDPEVLNRKKSIVEKIAARFKEEVAVVDILAEAPLSQHESLNPNDTSILYRSGGGTVLNYSADTESKVRFIFYGPELFALENTPVYATNLEGFPQTEININASLGQDFKVSFDEAEYADVSEEDSSVSFLTDGESHSTAFVITEKVEKTKTSFFQRTRNRVLKLFGKEVTEQERFETTKNTFYSFKLDDLNKSTYPGNQGGNNRLDAQAIKRVSINSVVKGEGAIAIDSFKLKKAETFFVRYFWIFLAASILFFLAYTVYATPFVAFGYEMTPDYHERTRLHAFANMIGQLAWLGVPWFYAIMSSSLFRDTVHGARVLAVGVGIIVAILGIVPAIFCREKQTRAPKAAEGFLKNMGEFLKGIGTTFKCSPFVKLCGATFLVFNGFQLGMSFSLYVMIYYLFLGNDSDAGKLMGSFGTLTAICTLCVIPLTGWIATHIGKRKTFLITISLSIVGYAIKWVGYNPAHPYWLLFSSPLVAFGTGSLFTLMGSMISDVCDYDELKTHQRREGVFGAIYWWMVKVGMALAGLLTGVLLKVSGFDVALGAGQADKTLFLLRVFDVGIPIITSAVALGIIATYAITEEKAHEIRRELEDRRGKVSAAAAENQ